MTNIVIIGVLALAAQQTDTTFAVRPNGSVAVENFAGAVRVGSWDRAQLRVVARHSSRTELDINTVGGRVEIEVAGRFGPGQADLELTVPRSFGVAVEGVNTAIEVRGVEGDLALETVNGDITVQGARGRVHLETVQGLVVIEDSNGRISASSMNRGVQVRNSTGEFEVEAVNGPVLLHGIDSRRVDAETVNGAVEYDGRIHPDGSYSLASHNGRITMAIPEGTNARVSAYTFNGRLVTSFPVELGGTQARVQTTRSTGGERGRYSFTIGSGGATIELESFGGAIMLVRPGEIGRRGPPPERER